MNLAAWITSLVPSLVRLVLAALGLSVVVFTGLDYIAEQLKDFIIASYNSLPSDILILANLAGLGTALNMILSVMISRFAIFSALNTSRIIGTNTGGST